MIHQSFILLRPADETARRVHFQHFIFSSMSSTEMRFNVFNASFFLILLDHNKSAI